MRRRDIMTAWGFSADPFSLFVAETEDRLGRSFVAPHDFDEIVGDPERPQPTFVFGSRGEGKGTLCRMVAQRLRTLPGLETFTQHRVLESDASRDQNRLDAWVHEHGKEQDPR